jgi:hypothetical protein
MRIWDAVLHARCWRTTFVTAGAVAGSPLLAQKLARSARTMNSAASAGSRPSIPEFPSTENATDIRLLFGPFVSMCGTHAFKRRPKMPFNYSFAPAINPLPPSDGRCTRAAGFPARRLFPAAGDEASGARLRPPFECIALLLQGGVALSAYQSGSMKVWRSRY